MPTPSTSGLHGHLLAPVVTFRQDDSKSERRSCCCALLAAQLLYAATFFALLRKQLVCVSPVLWLSCVLSVSARVSHSLLPSFRPDQTDARLCPFVGLAESLFFPARRFLRRPSFLGIQRRPTSCDQFSLDFSLSHLLFALVFHVFIPALPRVFHSLFGLYR